MSPGVDDGSGHAGLTLKEARAHAGELSKLYQSGIHDLHAHLAQQEAERQAAIKAAAAEREAAERQATLGDLLTAYADMLEAAQKPSANE